MCVCVCVCVCVCDSIEEVYCNVAVKLSGNIVVHALMDNLVICENNSEVFL